jgi:exosortase
LLSLLAAITWSYWPIIARLWMFLWTSDDYSAGLLVPPVAAYVVWSRRHALMQTPMQVCWWGLAVLVFSQGVRAFGTLYLYGSLERYSLLVALFGATLLVFGWRIVRQLVWVFAFLLLTIPLPNRIHEQVAVPLQNFAAHSAVFGLDLLGFLVAKEGNTLRLSTETTIAVAEACNGLRMLTAFVIVAGTLALVIQSARWVKAVLMISSVLVAILANSLRLIITAVLFEMVGSDAAEDFFHDFAGLLMMPVAIAILAGELYLLREKCGGGPKESSPPAGHKAGHADRRTDHQQDHKSGWSTAHRLSVGVALMVLISAGIGHRVLLGKIEHLTQEATMPAQPLKTIPLSLGPWEGIELPLEEAAIRIAGDDDWISRVYRNRVSGEEVAVYVGYIGRPRARMHRPDICYPSHGFTLARQEDIVIPREQDEDVPALLMEFKPPQLGDLRQLSCATFIIQGRLTRNIETANQYSSREIGLLNPKSQYVARIQLSTPILGDRSARIAAMQDLGSRIVDPVLARMPDEQDRGQ